MKRPFLVSSVAVLAFSVSCATAPAPSSKEPAGSSATPAATAPAAAKGAQAPSPTPAPAPSTDAALPRTAEEILQKIEPKTPEPKREEASDIFVDPATGKRLQRIPKSAVYNLIRDRLYNAVINDTEGVPLIRQDQDYYYVEAPPLQTEETLERERSRETEQYLRSVRVEVPASEGEVVTVQPSPKRFRFEEISDGLPTTGMWRENFALGDLYGDGKLEIVSPPPRLSGRQIQVFRLEGSRWVSVFPEFDDPERIGFEYGGLIVTDMDGDGKADIVFGRHGRGPAIAFNKGGLKFKIESRGLPRAMSLRSLAAGDLDGDGKPDLVALSDEPEYMNVREAERKGQINVRAPDAEGYVPGIDTRAFLSREGRFQEVSKGFEGSCYGYAMSLWAPAPDGREPFVATSCRYKDGIQVLYTYHAGEKVFSQVGQRVVEQYAAHIGVAAGLYQGHPAAFMSYLKVGPEGASHDIRGDGISIYYRDGDEWKRKRIVKTLRRPYSSQGIAVADLDGDGLDDVVFADEATRRIRVFFQERGGDFRELDPALCPTFVNQVTAIRVADIDGDGFKEIVLMYQYLTDHKSRAGGFRVFRFRP